MSTENQTLAPPAQTQSKTVINIGNRGIELRDFESLWRFSVAVAGSGLAPKGIQSKEGIFVAIQMGLEVGMTPMAALQNIAVINGRPSIWGDAQLAIVRATSELAAFEECETNNDLDPIFRELCLEDDPTKRKALRIQIAKAQSKLNRTADDFGVTVFIHRRSYEPAFSRFTVADAKLAGLWGKDGPWKQYSARMLKNRARSFGLRDNFGDALKGMRSAEEAQDMPTERNVTGTGKGVGVERFLGQEVNGDADAEAAPPARETAPATPKPTRAKAPAPDPRDLLLEIAATHQCNVPDILEGLVYGGSITQEEYGDDWQHRTLAQIPDAMVEEYLGADRKGAKLVQVLGKVIKGREGMLV